jgi:hypothetical protein
MPTVQAPVQLTVDHLLAAVKQLSPAELQTFMQQLATWQQQNGQLTHRRGRSVAGVSFTRAVSAGPGTSPGARILWSSWDGPP